MKTGYQFNIEKMQTIKPSMAYKGENFLSWQKEARAKLSELLGLQTFTKCAPELEIEFEKEIEGGKEIRFTYQSEEGYRVPCHLVLPDGVEKPPVIICLQGHSSGMHISLFSNFLYYLLKKFSYNNYYNFIVVFLFLVFSGFATNP